MSNVGPTCSGRVFAPCGHELWSECCNCGYDDYGRLKGCPKCGSNDDAIAVMLGDDREYEHECPTDWAPAPSIGGPRR